MNRFNKKAEDPTSIVISAIFLGVVVLFAAWGSSRAVEYLSPEGSPAWVVLFISGAAMLAVSLILVLASSMGDPTRFGFTRPKVGGGYGVGITWGIVLGIAASILNLAAGGGGLGPVQGLGFVQIVLLVWILASVAEEVLVRGYVQSYLQPLAHVGFTVFRLRISLPVALSALFFSAMHLILLTTDTSFLTIYVVLVFTFFLGLVTAYQRERTGSVLPAVAAHVSFNVGGMIGGIVFVVAQIALFGKTAAEVAKALSG
jgi:membrane protease YdiL (CAAX protease family)